MSEYDFVIGFLNYGLDWVKDNRPIGISYDDCLWLLSDLAGGTGLDQLSYNFGLVRIVGESDESLRIRLKLYLKEHRHDGSTVCVHNWTRYQGFTEAYDYCTICDEKKR